MRTVELGRQGDATTRMITVEWGVEISSERAHGKVADLT
jgi:hypothetical protein